MMHACDPNVVYHNYEKIADTSVGSIVRPLKEDQPLRLLLNLLFYHFYRFEPNYKPQCIKLLDVIVACNQLNVNALN